jgi:hypothetical protein
VDEFKHYISEVTFTEAFGARKVNGERLLWVKPRADLIG